MKLYHRTTRKYADAISKEGFKDQTGIYGTGIFHEGIWISNVPLDINEGAIGDVFFSFDIPEKIIAAYEWIEECKPYREFLVPVKILNKYLRKKNWKMKIIQKAIIGR